MGCGSSTTQGGAGQDLDAVVDENYGIRSAAPHQDAANGERSSKPGRRTSNQLHRVSNSDSAGLWDSPCKLGKKAIQNSFVVQKQRNKNRHREFDTGAAVLAKGAGSNDEFATKGGASFLLPAENAVPEEFLGVSRSAPSMKMARPNMVKPKPSRFGPSGGGAVLGTEGDAAADGTRVDDGANVGEEDKSSELDAPVEDGKAMLYSSDLGVVIKGVTLYREKLSMVNPPVAEVRSEGIIPRLVALLEQDTDRKLQYEVVWTLTNICSAEHEDCQDVVDQGAVPGFIRLLKSCDDVDVLEQVIWALGNIAADSRELQKLVLDEGIVSPLMEAIATHMQQPTFLRHSAWLLSNLCRPKPQNEDLYLVVPTIKALLEGSDDIEVATHSLWSLAYISADEEALDSVMEIASVLPKLVAWVREAGSSMTTPSLRILGNLCSGSSESTQAVVELQGVPAILACLHATTRDAVRKECAWSLSNIAAGTCIQVQALAEADVFTQIGLVIRGADDSLKRECAYVLANPWGASVKVTLPVAQLMMQQGVLHDLVSFLDVVSPPPLIIVALEGLSDAVKKGMFLALNQPRDDGGHEDETTDAAPVHTNPVVVILKEVSVVEKLDALADLLDDAVSIKLKTFRELSNL